MILPDHHAILAEGDKDAALMLFRDYLGGQGREIGGDPDIVFVDFSFMGIDEARSLVGLSHGAPLRDKYRTVVVSIGEITKEAENALLKLFEDPSPHTKFLITFPNANALLPTLRSRLHIVRLNNTVDDGGGAKEFINMSIGERLAYVEKVVKAGKDTGSKSDIRSFLQALRVSFAGEGSPTSVSKLQAIDRALLYVEDKGASVKLLLESVALAL